MRAALYVRLSEETDTTTSPERQRTATALYAASRGWTVVGPSYDDVDVSATRNRLDRPALTRLRADARAGLFDVVVVYRLDRLARDALDALTLLEEWRRIGVAIASTSEGIDATTLAGKAMFTLVAAFAELEAGVIGARVAASQERLRADGRFAGGTVPFGYTPVPREDGAGRVLALLEEEADVVREAARRLLAGEAPYRVCQDYNSRGVPAPRSEYRKVARMTELDRRNAGMSLATADRGTWRAKSLVRMLTSDHVAGRQTHRGELQLDERGLPATVWPPVITGAQLDQLRGRLRVEGAEPVQRHRRAARLLSGVIFCDECSHKMYVRNSGGRPIYGCPTAGNGGLCASPRISAEAVEEYVERAALARLGDVAMTEPVAREEAPAAVAELAEVERALREVADEMTRLGADLPRLGERLALLHSTREEVLARGGQQTYFVTSRPTGLSWRQTYEALDVDGRRRLLTDFIWSVRIMPTSSRSPRMDEGRVRIIWEPEE